MNLNIEGMSLSQALNAVAKIQTILDQAAQDRADFVSRHGMSENATENGTLMAYYWHEQVLKHLAMELRDSIVRKFEKEEP